MAFLKVHTRDEERTVFLADAPVVIGRGEQTDCMLPDAKASRRHCVIEPHGGGGWRVRDLGSGNGTRVNGKRVRKRELHPEDVVQVGDARIVFAGEGAAVVEAEPAASASAREEPAGEPAGGDPRERARRTSRPVQRRSVTGWIVAGVLVVLGGAALVFVPRGESERRDDPAERRAWHAVASAEGTALVIERAERYLLDHPNGEHADQIRKVLENARARRDAGASASGVIPDGLDALPPAEAVARLEELRDGCEPALRPVVDAELTRQRERLDRENQEFFAGLRDTFRELVGEGRYAQAREIWFFLRGDERWSEAFVRPIHQALEELEIAAAADRSRLFDRLAGLESEGRLDEALAILEREAPRFAGTAVARSLDEKVAFLRDARRRGVTPRRGPEPVPPVPEGPDLHERLDPILVRLGQRAFSDVAARLRSLAAELPGEAARATVAARVREAEAVAAVQRALEERLAAGDLPGNQILRRWRVLAGGPDGLRVREKGEETDYAWHAVPAPLHLALLERAAGTTSDGALARVVAAHAFGTAEQLRAALAVGYEAGEGRELIDRFVADRVRREPLPEGGYVVHAGEILSRGEYVERVERERIEALRTELATVLETIGDHRVFAKLEALRERKDALDDARDHALELIYDEKRYFYPYRGTGREGEYWPVQKEVDARVAGVREVWEDRTTVTVKADAALERALTRFDGIVAELEGKGIDTADDAARITFLRSYLGRKFDVKSFYRTPDERDLLRYSVEVLEDNREVAGDISEVEREQVRVTNAYRMMFGRWPCRIVEELVLSSRGHCEEMSRLGYFGHFSPTPGRRTPYDRMKLAGYRYGASENCALGQTTAEGAHNAWCHSSGHHRNLLMPDWTEMGTGHHGRYMTQNFGRAPRRSKAWAAETPRNPGRAAPREPEDGDASHDEGFEYGD